MKLTLKSFFVRGYKREYKYLYRYKNYILKFFKL